MTNPIFRWISRLTLLGCLVASPPTVAETGHGTADSGAAPGPVPLYDNLGGHHHAITTEVPKAQQYFDQGLRLVYAFNHAEAVRAFGEAARLDPGCAMCYWGAALAYGPHINGAMDAVAGEKAYAMLQKAIALAPQASASERAYIQALARRYARPPPANRSKLDAAYANAMAAVAKRFPEDLDAATLSAEALMDLSPWDYWTSQGRPKPHTAEILALLDSVIARDPDHPGACHYYIHIQEAAHPEQAVACAERLARLMPGAGHIVHMPAHIYIRVGRYADAIESNRHAVHTDEGYLTEQHPSGIYPLTYYPHNLHFLAFAAAMAGQSAQAVEAARALAGRLDLEAIRQYPGLETLVAYPQLTLVTFGRWDEVLAAPLPADGLRFAGAMAHYARGVAFAAKARWHDADLALGKMKNALAATPAGINRTVLKIAAQALAGEIAARQGRPDAAADRFTRAVELEDSLRYSEPPYWYYPMRHSLGKALLAAGRPQAAERVYREDLMRYPENGWALFGLEASLLAQGQDAEAGQAKERFAHAWAGADVALTASRF